MRCVCASMNPGMSVTSPRSITSAPAGTLALAPVPAIFPSVTTTTPGLPIFPLFPSNIRAALMTVVFPAAAAMPKLHASITKSAHTTK